MKMKQLINQLSIKSNINFTTKTLPLDPGWIQSITFKRASLAHKNTSKAPSHIFAVVLH